MSGRARIFEVTRFTRPHGESRKKEGTPLRRTTPQCWGGRADLAPESGAAMKKLKGGKKPVGGLGKLGCRSIYQETPAIRRMRKGENPEGFVGG